MFHKGKSITDQDIKQLLRILVKALESFNDIVLLEAIVMCLTRLQPLLRPVRFRHSKQYTSIVFFLLITLYLLGISDTQSIILGGYIRFTTG